MSETISQPPIRTARLYLRRSRSDDAEDVYEFSKLPSVRRYTTRPPATGIEEVVEWLTEKRGGADSYNFVVILPDESGDAEVKDGEEVKGKVIGCLGSTTYPEIGYIFHPAYSGKGYATEAVQAFLPRLFERMPSASASADLSAAGQAWDYALARVDVENQPSIKLLERCGWTRGVVTEKEYTSAMLGLRDSVSYMIARPGMRLDGVLEAIRQKEEGTPPVPDLM